MHACHNSSLKKNIAIPFSVVLFPINEFFNSLNMQGGIQEMVEFCKTWKSELQKANLQAGHTNVREAIAVAISRGKLVASGSSAINSQASFPTTLPSTDNAEMVCKFANPWWAEIRVLIQRAMKNIRRTPELFLMRLATVMVTGFLLATIFWHLDHSPNGVQVLEFAISYHLKRVMDYIMNWRTLDKKESIYIVHTIHHV